MFSGHAYSRAVRAHLLVQIALSRIVFKKLALDNNDNELKKTFLQNLDESAVSFEQVEKSNAIGTLKRKFEVKIAELKKKAPLHNYGFNIFKW